MEVTLWWLRHSIEVTFADDEGDIPLEATPDDEDDIAYLEVTCADGDNTV